MLDALLENRLLAAAFVVVAVPAVLVGYILLIEAILRRVPRRLAPGLRPWLWLAPALAFLGVFLVYPTIATIFRSFMNRRGNEFIGLENYQWFFTQSDTLIALRNNALWVVLLPALVVGLGLLVAILVDRVRYEGVAKSIVFLPLAFFSNDLFTIVAQPLIDKLPEGNSLIATSVVAPFMTPLKLALVAAIFIAMPYVLYQIWAFIAPGLYRHEKHFALPLFASSVVLFYAGTAFAYFVVFPLMFKFLAMSTPVGVKMMTDISSYLDFVVLLFFAFGIAFETPVATVLLVASGLVSL